MVCFSQPFGEEVKKSRKMPLTKLKSCLIFQLAGEKTMLNKNILPFLIVFLVGCSATKPAVYMNNEVMPERVYTIRSSSSNIGMTALYFANRTIKDVDGSTVFRPEYFKISKGLEFSRTEVEGLYLRCAVVNPEKMTYTMKATTQVVFSDGRIEGNSIEVGRSALDQRTFTLTLPMPAKMERASYTLIMVNDKGQELLRIGELNYRILSPLVSR
jgi:hypothetical protein